MTVLGLPTAALLFIAGIVVIIAATVLHWVLVIIGVILIVAAIYLLITGNLGPF
jgi:hypothetical protein